MARRLYTRTNRRVQLISMIQNCAGSEFCYKCQQSCEWYAQTAAGNATRNEQGTNSGLVLRVKSLSWRGFADPSTAWRIEFETADTQTASQPALFPQENNNVKWKGEEGRTDGGEPKINSLMFVIVCNVCGRIISLQNRRVWALHEYNSSYGYVFWNTFSTAEKSSKVLKTSLSNYKFIARRTRSKVSSFWSMFAKERKLPGLVFRFGALAESGSLNRGTSRVRISKRN